MITKDNDYVVTLTDVQLSFNLTADKFIPINKGKHTVAFKFIINDNYHSSGLMNVLKKHSCQCYKLEEKRLIDTIDSVFGERPISDPNFAKYVFNTLVSVENPNAITLFVSELQWQHNEREEVFEFYLRI